MASTSFMSTPSLPDQLRLPPRLSDRPIDELCTAHRRTMPLVTQKPWPLHLSLCFGGAIIAHPPLSLNVEITQSPQNCWSSRQHALMVRFNRDTHVYVIVG